MRAKYWYIVLFFFTSYIWDDYIKCCNVLRKKCFRDNIIATVFDHKIKFSALIFPREYIYIFAILYLEVDLFIYFQNWEEKCMSRQSFCGEWVHTEYIFISTFDSEGQNMKPSALIFSQLVGVYLHYLKILDSNSFSLLQIWDKKIKWLQCIKDNIVTAASDYEG